MGNERPNVERTRRLIVKMFRSEYHPNGLRKRDVKIRLVGHAHLKDPNKHRKYHCIYCRTWRGMINNVMEDLIQQGLVERDIIQHVAKNGQPFSNGSGEVKYYRWRGRRPRIKG